MSLHGWLVTIVICHNYYFLLIKLLTAAQCLISLTYDQCSGQLLCSSVNQWPRNYGTMTANICIRHGKNETLHTYNIASYYSVCNIKVTIFEALKWDECYVKKYGQLVTTLSHTTVNLSHDFMVWRVDRVTIWLVPLYSCISDTKNFRVNLNHAIRYSSHLAGVGAVGAVFSVLLLQYFETTVSRLNVVAVVVVRPLSY